MVSADAHNVPKVSVVIPTYNGAAVLLQTLESVFSQIYSDYEIVIVDDGCTDDTSAQLQRLRLTHPLGSRLRIVQQSNSGIGHARNRGMKLARGKYVALLDHDDLWMPAKLERQVAFFESHPQCAAVTVPWSKSTAPAIPLFDRQTVCDAGGLVHRPISRINAGQNIIITSAIMIDREKAGDLRFVTERDCVEDLAFQFQLLGRGAFGVAGDEILMVYRIHSQNFSRNAIRYYHGMPMLRQLDSRGAFDELTGADREDLTRLLGSLGQLSGRLLAFAGRKLLALRIFISEWKYQFRLGQYRYLVVFPLALLMPKRLLRWRWRSMNLSGGI